MLLILLFSKNFSLKVTNSLSGFLTPKFATFQLSDTNQTSFTCKKLFYPHKNETIYSIHETRSMKFINFNCIMMVPLNLLIWCQPVLVRKNCSNNAHKLADFSFDFLQFFLTENFKSSLGKMVSFA